MDTIVAISTAPGIGGIGIVRISGEKCFQIIKQIFQPKNAANMDRVKGYTIKYGYIINPSSREKIDEVLVSFFKGPKSYTTEDMCEINSHGGIIVLKEILQLCLENGAKIAEPGEFTKRAFLNGRIDLLQAEGVIDIIHAKTKKEKAAHLNQLEGVLSAEIKQIRQMALDILVDIEATIDYPEYDIEEVTKNGAVERLYKIQQELIKLEKSFDKGKIIKEGISVAIIGKPNAGKSSLLNALLREERAIVTEIEGTTRDTIEEYIDVQGIPVKIIDTAGIREAKDRIESIGIEKSREIAKKADLIIAVFDSSKELEEEDKEILDMIKARAAIVVLNKTDLENQLKDDPGFKEIPNLLEISALERKGIEELTHKIVELFDTNDIGTEGSALVTNIRHKELIKKANLRAEEALQDLQNDMPIDIIAIHIKDILENLGEITGENVTDSVINAIFSKFCLGK